MIRFNGGRGARRILGVALSRDKILHTAYEVLATYGLADLSMRRLASELQVAPGALYSCALEAASAGVAVRLYSGARPRPVTRSMFC